MAHVAQALFIATLETMLLVAMPVVCCVALVGVIVGALQTAFGVQDQNVSFAPKLVVIGVLVAAGGATALDAARRLAVTCLQALPTLAHW